VKVVLSGEGADELFLGYNRYRVTAWNDRLGARYRALTPAALRAGVARLVRWLPRNLHRYAGRTFLALASDPRTLVCENFAVFGERAQRALLADPALVAARDPHGEALRRYAEAPGGVLERMGRVDLETYLVELLMKQDQMSMAASVESRVPFLDHEFVEYATAIPARLKLRGWRTKAILRAALRDLVPHAILTRPKMGFPVPVGRWLRGRFWPVVEELVLGPRASARGLFDPEAVRRMAEAHRPGAEEHGDRLWLLLTLELWHRIFVDGEDVGGRWPKPALEQSVRLRERSVVR
jgi:asparagine synthase (glutamine-hydrolysing)